MAQILMQRVRSLINEGLPIDQVAETLMVSRQWVMMLMSADSFQLVKGVDDGQGKGEAGRDDGEAEGGEREEATGGTAKDFI